MLASANEQNFGSRLFSYVTMTIRYSIINLTKLIVFNCEYVSDQAKPPSDPVFENSWNFINPTVIEDPTPPTNIDEGKK